VVPGAEKYGGWLRILDSSSPGAFFGYLSEKDYVSFRSLNGLHERLCRLADTGELTPMLAEKWEFSPDMKTVTFTLKKGIKFHDGSDLNAKVAVWNIGRLMSTGLSQYVSWEGAEVIDDYTFKLFLKEFTNEFGNSVARASMISMDAYMKNGEDWINKNPVGTGPFKFVELNRDQNLKYEKFEDYWQEGLPYLDGVEMVFIKDEMTRVAAFLNDEGQVIVLGNPKNSSDLENMGYVVTLQPAYGGGPLVLDFDSKHDYSPFSNKLVREAVWYAIDKDAIVAARGFGRTVVNNQFVDVNHMAYDPNLPPRPYNPTKAKELLAEAGYPDGFSCTLWPAEARVMDPEVAVAVGEYLKAVGIDCAVEFVDYAKFADMRYITGWEVGMLGFTHAGNVNLASQFGKFMGPNCITSHTSWYSDEFAQALQDAMSTENLEPEKMRRLNQIAYEEVFQVPLNTKMRTDMLVPGVHDHGRWQQHTPLYWSPEIAWLSGDAMEIGLAIAKDME
jgi:peptide/nickel transport system substrate-binding protein